MTNINPKRIYLSGPMTGLPDNNFPAFMHWALYLQESGYEVVNPAEITVDGTWEQCLRADLRELCTCDALALMPGWEASKGAQLELHIAHRLGMAIVVLPHPDPLRVFQSNHRPAPSAGAPALQPTEEHLS